MIEKFHNYLYRLKRKYRYLAVPTMFLTVLYIISLQSIVRADRFYADDLARGSNGHRNFDFGRYVDNFLSVLIHTDTYLSDISPLTQYLGVMFLAVACVSLTYLLTRKINPADRGKDRGGIRYYTLLATYPMALGPHFLSCISYKYDSPYMSLSVLLCMLPFIVCLNGGYIVLRERYKVVRYLVVTCICTMLMCMSYQASSGIFPMVTVILCAKHFLFDKGKLKDSVIFALESVAGFLAGMVVYYLINGLDNIGYRNAGILKGSQLIPGFFRNLAKYYEYVRYDYRPVWKVLTAVIIVIFTLVILMQAGRVFLGLFGTPDGKHTVRSVLCSVFFAILIPGLLLTLCFGAYPFLQEPSFEPRAMYGFEVAVTIMSVTICTYLPRIWTVRAVCLALSWCFFSFTFTYGNLQYEQQRFAMYNTQLLMSDLISVPTMMTHDQKVILVAGQIKFAPNIREDLRRYRVVERMMDTGLGGEYFNRMYLERYLDIGYATFHGDDSDSYEEYDTSSLPLVKQTSEYKIYADEDLVFIQFE